MDFLAPHIVEKLLEHQNSVAIISLNDHNVCKWTYAALLRRALMMRDEILSKLSKNNEQPRVALLAARNASYLIIQWAIWLAVGIAVPLHPAHPADEMDYVVSDSGTALLIVSKSLIARDTTLMKYVTELSIRMQVEVIVFSDDVESGDEEKLLADQEKEVNEWVKTTDFNKMGAYMIYTSGTTGRPKGVVTTHSALIAQISDLVTTWEMTNEDHLIHFLPLHHIHGILNNLLCVMYVGGSVELLPFAKPSLIWSKLSEAVNTKRPVSMLMAVPTIYMKLLEEMEKQPLNDLKTQSALAGARRLRVAISGSMACPMSILNRWETLTGQRLLERYGMTELGMVLTNPLHGDRHLGYHEEKEGELYVKGPSVFSEYWKKPEATAKVFDAGGWFKTGDIVQYNNEFKSFRIRGRASADILKTAGYKVSALDVERVLSTHPQILECAVFGLPDETWEFSKEHLASYRVPRKYFFVHEIPKNAMGKVNKKALAKAYLEKAQLSC
ncbi:unnamed protein product [Peronospora belbahrii]|uniref:AMP-dependent synthetase/ligase domain-containing protein n=1 Tax=Peronospora belbahrii TaxID=622444 RepID=A0ABN8CNE5_9STRA|nr:unnamed protein product [Peronospora belbahrii]